MIPDEAARILAKNADNHAGELGDAMRFAAQYLSVTDETKTPEQVIESLRCIFDVQAAQARRMAELEYSVLMRASPSLDPIRTRLENLENVVIPELLKRCRQ